MPLSALLLPDGDLQRHFRAATPLIFLFCFGFLIPHLRLETLGQDPSILVCLCSPCTVGGVYGSALLNISGK